MIPEKVHDAIKIKKFLEGVIKLFQKNMKIKQKFNEIIINSIVIIALVLMIYRLLSK